MGDINNSQALYEYILFNNPSYFDGKTGICRSSQPSVKGVIKGPYWEFIENCGCGECMLAASSIYFESDLKTETFYQDQSEVGPRNGKNRVIKFSIN